MKRMTFLFLLAALFVPLFAARVYPVDLKKGKSVAPSVTTADLSVSIDLLGEKGGVYRAGKEIRFSFATTRDAYVIVYNIDSDGYVHLLWPEDGRLVLTEGGRPVSVPESGRDVRWETSDRTGIEYIHALAVSERDRIKDEELYFLAESDEMPAEKRFRIDTDPYLAFNMIDEQIVRDAESMAPATDYTYFYINREVDYPRYLCSKCHAPEKLSDPYAMQCPEIVIEEATYEQEPHYPYPPLYDIRHVGEQAADEEDYRSDRYSEKWLDEEGEGSGNDNHVYLSIYYGNYDWPYYGGYLFSYYPVYWDPWWWGFGWHSWRGGLYYPGWYWWYPYDYCWGNDWRWCGNDYYRGYRYRPISAERTAVKRYLDYRTTNTEVKRNRVIGESRLVKERREPVGSRLGRAAIERRPLDRNLGRAGLSRGDRTTVRGGDAKRRIIYGGDRAVRGGDRTRVIDRSRGDVNVRTPRSGGRSDAARTPRTRDSSVRDRSRGTDRGADRRERPPARHETPERQQAPERESPSRERSHDSSTDRQRSSDSNRGDRGADRRRISGFSTGTSSVGRAVSSPAPRYHEAPARSVSRAPSSASSPARSVSAPPPATRTRTR